MPQINYPQKVVPSVVAGHQFRDTGPDNGIFPITMMYLGFVGESHFSASTGHYFSDGLITQKMYFSQAIHRLVDENVQCDPISFAAFLPSGHHSLSELELCI